MASDAGRPEGFRRLHPSAIAFNLWSTAKYALLPGLFLIISPARATWEYWAMAFFVPASVVAVVLHLRYAYRLSDSDLVIRTGILGRYERHLPFSRIQDIRLVQTPFHRILGVAKVMIDTGSGAEEEATMAALSIDAVDEIRMRVFPGRRAAMAGEPLEGSAPGGEETELVHMGLSDLMAAGFARGKGWIVVGAILGLTWEAATYLDIPVLRDLSWRGLLAGLFTTDLLSPGGILLILLIVAAAFLILRLLSMAWTMVTFWNFTLTRTGSDLRVSTGLLTRLSANIPAHRIQTVAVSETWLQRMLGLASVRARTAGGLGGEEGEAAYQWLAPSLERPRADGLLAELLGGFDPGSAPWSSVDPRARRRLLRQWLILISVSMLALPWLLGAWGVVLPLGLLPLALLDSRRSAAGYGYVLTREAFAVRRGWWLRKMIALEPGRIQAVRITASPFDRRYGMATIFMDTAGGGGQDEEVSIPYLPVGRARSLRDALAARVAGTRFEW